MEDKLPKSWREESYLRVHREKDFPNIQELSANDPTDESVCVCVCNCEVYRLSVGVWEQGLLCS